MATGLESPRFLQALQRAKGLRGAEIMIDMDLIEIYLKAGGSGLAPYSQSFSTGFWTEKVGSASGDARCMGFTAAI